MALAGTASTAVLVSMVLTVGVASMVVEALEASNVLAVAMAKMAAMVWTVRWLSATWVAMVSTVDAASVFAAGTSCGIAEALLLLLLLLLLGRGRLSLRRCTDCIYLTG